MDKMRGEGVRNLSVFVHAQGIKPVYAGPGVGGWRQKMENSVHVVVE